MKNVPYLLLAQVREMFDYDPVSGLLIKKKFSNRRGAGPVFTTNSLGYVTVFIEGKIYGAHRIIWLHQKGYLPKQIDHINRCKADNRMCNLREATSAQNQRNKRCNPILGIPGVNKKFLKQKEFCWVVTICENKKTFRIGSFDSFREAVCHRWAAEQCVDEEFYGFNSLAKQYVKEFVQNRIHCTPINDEPEINTKPKKKKQEKKLYKKKPKLTFMQYQQKLAQALCD